MIRLVCVRPQVELRYDMVHLTPLKENRPLGMRIRAGGAGVSAGRCFSGLSVEYILYLMAGGVSGKLLINLMDKEKLCYDIINSESQTDMLTCCSEQEGQTIVSGTGEKLSPAELSLFSDRVEQSVRNGDVVLFCGKEPNSDVPKYFENMIKTAVQNGGLPAVDSDGNLAGMAINLSPFLLRTDVKILKEKGVPVENPSKIREWLMKKGIAILLFCEGNGVYRCVTRGGCYSGKLQGMGTVEERVTLSAGFITGVIKGLDTVGSFRSALACAAAYRRAGNIKVDLPLIFEEISKTIVWDWETGRKI